MFFIEMHITRTLSDLTAERNCGPGHNQICFERTGNISMVMLLRGWGFPLTLLYTQFVYNLLTYLARQFVQTYFNFNSTVPMMGVDRWGDGGTCPPPPSFFSVGDRI